MRSAATLFPTALFVCVLGYPGSGRAQLVPLGAQFQVNSYTTNTQVTPDVAPLPDGGFVVVWQTNAGDLGDSNSLQAQRFDAAGNAVGDQFQVNTYTTNAQFSPAVAADAAGNFVVVWNSYGSAGTDTDYTSVQARRFDAAGVPQGPDFQVNTYTTDGQRFPDVAVDAAGNFVVVWHSLYHDGPDPVFPILARRYDSAGVAQGGEFTVNSFTTLYQYNATVAADAAGNFVVIWSNTPGDGLDTLGSNLKGQRFNSAGLAQGGEFHVNSYTTGSQRHPVVATDAAGNFVVVWQNYFSGSSGSDTGDPSIQARRFDAAGVAQGADFQVNSYATATQRHASVAFDGAGNFVIAWASYGSAGSDASLDSIQAQRYDAAGVAQGGEFQVNSYTTNVQLYPAVVGDAAGNFLVTWGSEGSSGTDQSTGSIQAQRYGTGRTILGKKILVKDPNGSEERRGVIALGRETSTDIGAAIVGDPTVSGATLRVITNGITDSDETYVLDAAGWSPAGTVGFKYTGPTDVDGDPVKKVIVKRTSGGTALLKALVKGNTGTQSMDVVPPNTGTDGGIILSINGGGTYCAAFGAGAGGTEVADTSKLWKIINASAEGCPVP